MMKMGSFPHPRWQIRGVEVTSSTRADSRSRPIAAVDAAGVAAKQATSDGGCNHKFKFWPVAGRVAPSPHGPMSPGPP